MSLDADSAGAARPEYLNYTYDMFLSSLEGEQSEAVRFTSCVDAVAKDGLFPFEVARLQAQYPRVQVARYVDWYARCRLFSCALGPVVTAGVLRRGQDGSVMVFPAVPVNEARVRLFVTSEHQPAHIDACAANIIDAGRRFDFLLPEAGTPS